MSETGNSPNSKIDQPSSSSPVTSDIVLAFLTAMEARDLKTASSFLGEGFKMTFPGNVHFSTLQELVAWGK